MTNKYNNNDSKNDYELLQEVIDGDENSFKLLYERYSLHIFNYIYRMISDTQASEEILQDVFMVLWLNAKSFQRKSTVKTWLFRIAHHKTVSWLRKAKRYAPLSDVSSSDLREKDTIEQTVETSINKEIIQSALSNLSYKHRAVIELAFFYRFSYKEISQIMNCPIGTVKSRMNYALKHLSRLIDNEF